MNFTKASLIKKIVKDSALSSEDASSILESFLLIVKSIEKSSLVKLSSFGTFSVKKTPKRLGRNPKTKDSYIIPSKLKLKFKPSNLIKGKIN